MSLVLLHDGGPHVLDVVLVGVELLLVSPPHGRLLPLLAHLRLLLLHPLPHLLEQVLLVGLDGLFPVGQSLLLLHRPLLLLPVIVLPSLEILTF